MLRRILLSAGLVVAAGAGAVSIAVAPTTADANADACSVTRASNRFGRPAMLFRMNAAASPPGSSLRRATAAMASARTRETPRATSSGTDSRMRSAEGAMCVSAGIPVRIR